MPSKSGNPIVQNKSFAAKILNIFYAKNKDAVVLLKGTKIVDCNESTGKLFIVKTDEFVGKDITEFFPHRQSGLINSKNEFANKLKEVKTEEQIDFNWKFINGKNNVFNTYVVLSKADTEEFDYLMNIRDVDEQKKIEELLRESELRYRNIVENSSELIIRLDSAWRFAYVNPAFKEILHFDEDYLTGRTLFELIPSDSRDELENKLKSLAKTNPQGFSIEIPLIGKEKDLYYFTCTVRTILKNEKIHRYQISGINITDNKNLEIIRDVFYEITHTILKPIDLKELFREIHKAVAKLMPSKNLYIALYDEKTGLLSFPYFIDQYDKPPKPRKLRKGLTEYVLHQGKSLLATKEKYLELAEKGEIELIGEFPVDWLGVPLKVQNKTIGVIAVQSYDKEIRYDESSRQALEYVSAQIAIAIERKRYEEEIKKSLSLLKATLESTDNGLLVVDKQGRVQLFNRNFLKIWGIPEEIMQNGTDTAIIEYVHDKLRNPIEFMRRVNMLNELPEEKAWDTLEFKDGRIIERYTQPYRIGEEIVGRVWSFKDITEREKIKKKIEYEQYLLHLLMNNIPDAIFFKDKDCRYIRINKAQAQLLGVLSEKQVLGKTDFDYLSKDVAVEFFNDDVKILKTGKPLINKVEKISLSQGVDKWISTTKVPTYDNFGNVTGLVGISRDITQEKLKEEKLRKYSEELKELNVTKDRFLSIIAHDLKSPFSTLLGFLEILKEEYADLPKEQLGLFIENAAESAKNVFALLENLLQWAYLQKGKVVINKQKVNLFEITEETVKILSPNADKKKIKILNKVDKKLFSFSDKNLIQTVIRNITNNAIKFTEEEGKIELNARKQRDDILFSISDNGVGMDEETKEKLFRLDENVSRTGTSGEKGTGLGLIICKDMVEKNGGKIWVESQKGKGTTFYFTLPDYREI